jgi:hypothetical protein
LYGGHVAAQVGSEFLRPHAVTVDHEDNLWLG